MFRYHRAEREKIQVDSSQIIREKKEKKDKKNVEWALAKEEDIETEREKKGKDNE